MPAITRSNPEPIVDIVVPVYNEEHDRERSVRRLRTYLDERFPFAARITVADNASTDATVVAYMDVDLSTGLDALLPLVAGLLSGHYEIAIGSRLAPGAHVVRGPKREIISRGYNLILRSLLSTRFHDAQCGFNALRADVARELLPLVEDQAWFFDKGQAIARPLPRSPLSVATTSVAAHQHEAQLARGDIRLDLGHLGWEGRRLQRQLGDPIRPLRRRYDWVLGGQCQ
jgi:hypothetical protein